MLIDTSLLPAYEMRSDSVIDVTLTDRRRHILHIEVHADRTWDFAYRMSDYRTRLARKYRGVTVTRE